MQISRYPKIPSPQSLISSRPLSTDSMQVKTLEVCSGEESHEFTCFCSRMQGRREISILWDRNLPGLCIFAFISWLLCSAPCTATSARLLYLTAPQEEKIRFLCYLTWTYRWEEHGGLSPSLLPTQPGCSAPRCLYTNLAKHPHQADAPKPRQKAGMLKLPTFFCFIYVPYLMWTHPWVHLGLKQQGCFSVYSLWHLFLVVCF